MTLRDHVLRLFAIRLFAPCDAHLCTDDADQRRGLRGERLRAVSERHHPRVGGDERTDVAASENAQPRWVYRLLEEVDQHYRIGGENHECAAL